MATQLSFSRVEAVDHLGVADLGFRGFRMPAFDLDHMLACAVVHASDGDYPLLSAIHVSVTPDKLTLCATDTVTFLREQRVVNSYGDPSEFLLQAADVRTFRALLRSVLKEQTKELRDVVAADVHLGDTGFLEVFCGDRRAAFAPQAQGDDEVFPVDSGLRMIENLKARTEQGYFDAFDVGMSARLIKRIEPLEKAGYGVFRYCKANEGKYLVATPLHPHEQHGLYERDAQVVIGVFISHRPKDSEQTRDFAADFLRSGSGLVLSKADVDKLRADLDAADQPAPEDPCDDRGGGE